MDTEKDFSSARTVGTRRIGVSVLSPESDEDLTSPIGEALLKFERLRQVRGALGKARLARAELTREIEKAEGELRKLDVEEGHLLRESEQLIQALGLGE